MLRPADHSLPPGPAIPPAAQLLWWTVRPGVWLERCHARYGDVFTMRTPGAEPLVFLADPGDVKTVFTADPEVVPAGVGRDGIRPMFGDSSLLLLDGAEHLRRRRLLLPPFHGRAIAGYAATMEEVTERELAQWSPGRPFRLQDALQRITLDVILRCVFGMEDGARMDALRERLRNLLALTASPLAFLPVAMPVLRRGFLGDRFLALRAKTDAHIYDVIRRRRAAPDLDEREDVLSLLLRAADEDGRPLGDEALRDELITLLLAGHETTATALAWTFDALWRHPAGRDRLSAEARDPDAPGDYADAVIQETLRLRPPIAFGDRTLAAPLELGGHALPAGCRIAPCIYLVHRRPDVYPAPRAFRPERFLEHPPETYTWLPFGGGVRRCLGASFATLEMKVVLRTILRRRTVGPASSRPETARRRSIVLAPAHGSRAVVEAA
ncbi:MAG TPA: cytochrome P450 [Solirubrobacteraceae bacterium]|nr:cytochrome P450 [Solirubrobacteraceae bacterium]